MDKTEDTMLTESSQSQYHEYPIAMLIRATTKIAKKSHRKTLDNEMLGSGGNENDIVEK